MAWIGEGGPEENGRVWVGTEMIYELKLKAGELILLSLGTSKHTKREKSGSGFAPSGLSVERYAEDPPVSLWKRWDEEIGIEGLGEWCVGCDVWPNGKVEKGEIRLSGAVMAQLRNPEAGRVVYIHQLAQKPVPCQKLSVRSLHSVAVGRDEPEGWLEEILSGGGSTQMQVLKMLILRQLNGRLVLQHNVVPILMLGCALLLHVTQLTSTEGLVDMAVVDGDTTIVELDTSKRDAFEQPRNAEFLNRVSEGAGREMEGSRQEAAIAAALEATRSGCCALDRITLEQIVVPDPLLQSLQSLVVMPLTNPEIFTSMGLALPRGVILHGPPGSGKTVLASWAASKSDAHLFVINGPSLLSAYYGGAESGLAGIFRAAKAVAPSLIFIDEMDAIVPSRGGIAHSIHAAQDSSIRLTTTLLSQFDNLDQTPVVVLAATNRLESIDDALRRPGRFDREIEVGLPTPNLRQALFTSHLQKISHALTEQEICTLASDAHGFLPVDVAVLCRAASLFALRRHIADRHTPLSVTRSDFQKAKNLIKPSGLRELKVEVPSVDWEDIGGLDGIKQQLKESIEWPIKHAAALHRMGTTAPKGVLLFGPPGCSKTLLAKAVATETGMNFISIAGSEMFSMYVGQSEKAIARLFARARQVAPCIVFMDEIDGLLSHRDGDDGTAVGQRVLAQVLTEMDGIRDRGHVIVIGATNKPQLVDAALLRPGRFDRLILVPPPDEQARKAIFEIQFRSMSVSDDVDSGELAKRTESFSGADITAVCRQAGIHALEADIQAEYICMKHFVQAVEATVPSLGNEEKTQMELYRRFQRGV